MGGREGERNRDREEGRGKERHQLKILCWTHDGCLGHRYRVVRAMAI